MSGSDIDADADEPQRERLHRATIEFGLTEADALRFDALVEAIDVSEEEPDRIDAALDALGHLDVLEAAWSRWTDDEALDLIDAMVQVLQTRADADTTSDRARGGLVALHARQRLSEGRLSAATEALEAARSTGDPAVLIELAMLAADRSQPLEAKSLLDQAGVDTAVDLDAEYEPNSSAKSRGEELADEIAPFAAMRPKPMAKRNDPCPCGSGRKYKHCHTGNEMHPIDQRSSWLYVKLMRFLHTFDPQLLRNTTQALVENITDDGINAMITDSYLPMDIALFEGGAAKRYLDTMGSILPGDEQRLLAEWIDVRRTVFEVERSRRDELHVIALDDRRRVTVTETLPVDPFEAGWLILGRLTPVGDTTRCYGGFLPVNDDMVDSLIAAMAPGDWDMTTLAINQLFDVAATATEISSMINENLDLSELQALADQFERESSGED